MVRKKREQIVMDDMPPLEIEEDPFMATVMEISLFILICLTFGALLSAPKLMDTSRSYVHCLFKPLDDIMLSGRKEWWRKKKRTCKYCGKCRHS